MAEPERVQWLVAAGNAVIIRQKKSNAIVEIQLREFGDDAKLRSRQGNAQDLSYDYETDDNPRNVWALKRVPALERY